MNCIPPEPVTQRVSGQSMFAAGWLRLGTDRARSGPETGRERSWTAPCCDLLGHGASSSPWAIALPRAMAFRAGLPRRPPGLRGLVVPGPPIGISPASQSSSIRQRRRSFGRVFEQGSTRTASRLAGQWPTERRILGCRSCGAVTSIPRRSGCYWHRFHLSHGLLSPPATRPRIHSGPIAQRWFAVRI